MVRHGSPTNLQPQPEGVTACHELVNTDASEPGRVQGRPVAVPLYVKGSADTSPWPRNGATS